MRAKGLNAEKSPQRVGRHVTDGSRRLAAHIDVELGIDPTIFPTPVQVSRSRSVGRFNAWARGSFNHILRSASRRQRPCPTWVLSIFVESSPCYRNGEVPSGVVAPPEGAAVLDGSTWRRRSRNARDVRHRPECRNDEFDPSPVVRVVRARSCDARALVATVDDARLVRLLVAPGCDLASLSGLRGSPRPSSLRRPFLRVRARADTFPGFPFCVVFLGRRLLVVSAGWGVRGGVSLTLSSSLV